MPATPPVFLAYLLKVLAGVDPGIRNGKPRMKGTRNVAWDGRDYPAGGIRGRNLDCGDIGALPCLSYPGY